MAIDKLPPLQKELTSREKMKIKRQDDADAKKAEEKIIEKRNPRKSGEDRMAYRQRLRRIRGGVKLSANEIRDKNNPKNRADKGIPRKKELKNKFKADKKDKEPGADTSKPKTKKTPIVTKKQLEDSGFTTLRDYLNNERGLTRRDGKKPVMRDDNTKPPKPGNRADVRNSPKYRAGGMLKPAPNKGFKELPKSVRNDMGFMKKGGPVKKCRMDGIALRGKTRAKERSK